MPSVLHSQVFTEAVNYSTHPDQFVPNDNLTPPFERTASIVAEPPTTAIRL